MKKAAPPDPLRKGSVTQENRDEAAKLSELWEASKADREARGVGTQASFGHAFEIGNQSAVGFFLSGATALSLKAARGFALGLQVQIDQFSPRLAAMAAEYGRLAVTPHPGASGKVHAVRDAAPSREPMKPSDFPKRALPAKGAKKPTPSRKAPRK